MRKPKLVGNSLVLVEERAVPDAGLNAHGLDPVGQVGQVAELLVATPPGAAVVVLKPVVVLPGQKASVPVTTPYPSVCS